MIDKIRIDGTDAYTEWGVFIVDGGYNGLVSFPQLKEPDKNDWAEEDGIEVDLSNPTLDTKEFSVKFGATKKADVGAFIEALSATVYHTFYFQEILRTKNLRFVSNGSYDGTLDELRMFELTFADDFPTLNYSYLAPNSTLVNGQTYELDMVKLSTYGVTVLAGTNAEILKSPAVKNNLSLNLKSLNGQVYDSGRVKCQEKDVSIKCLMTADDLGDFWRNYDALLFNLSKPNSRLFYAEILNEDIECYYKSSTVSDFSFDGRVWCQFDLCLCFTNYRSVEEITRIFNNVFSNVFS